MNYVLLFFALTCFCNASFCQYSDLKDYGLKGNVKSIDNFVYIDQKLAAKKWKVQSTDTAFFMKHFHFNRSGQMDTLWTKYDEKDSSYNSLVVFDLEENKKVRFRNYNSMNELTESTDIEWLDNRTYRFSVKDTTGGISYESTSWLSVQFQDSAGHSIIYQNGEVIGNEKYVNRLDKSRRVIGVDYFDEFNNPTKSETIKYLKFDKKGNWTLAVVKDTFTGKFIKLTVRTLEYY